MRELEAGRLAVITKHGRPVGVTVPLTEQLLQHGVPLALAVELFRSHAVSLGLAAKIAGLPCIEFMEALGRLGIPVIDYDASELEQELKSLD